MADADVEITAGTGTKIDTRTVGADEHRQVVVLGDPVTAENVGVVDSFGRQHVVQHDPELNLTPSLTGIRDLLVAERTTIRADSMADGVAASDWVTTTANGGTVTSTGGEGVIQTSASATGSAQVVNIQTVSYLPGQVHWFNSAIRFGDTGSAGNIRRAGLFTVSGTTPQEGFAYELDGTTLYAAVYKAGTVTRVASTAWSRVATAPFTLDTNFHFFEIRYTGNTAWFYVDNVLRHVISGTGGVPITTTLNFPLAVNNVNTSGATNRVIGVRNIGMGRFGAAIVGSTGALGTDNNVNQQPTYMATVARTASGVLTANTAKAILSLEHAATSTKTVKIRKIQMHGYATTNLAGTVEFQIHRGTAASSAGTAITPTSVVPGVAAADTTVKSIPTITAATLVMAGHGGNVPATANSAIPQLQLYLWENSSQKQPLTLRAGNLDTIVLSIISTAAINFTFNVYVEFTEE